MKNSILLTLAAAFAFTAMPAIAQSGSEAKPAAAKYTCPMHPEVISDKQGKCPKCGMNLVLVKPSPTPKK